MTVVNDQLFLIGGRKVTERIMTNSVFKLDLNSLVWTKIEFDDKSQLPSERYFHSVDLWNDNLVLFGGMAYKNSDELVVLDDIYFFNLRNNNWNKIETSISPNFNKPNPPQPRYAHLSSISGDKLVISGGQGKDNQYIEEIAIFDLRSHEWIHSRAYDHQCGSYRSVAVSSPQRVVSPDPSTIRVGGEVLHLLPYTDNCTESDPSDIYIYSNYNFQDLKRELEVLEAPTNPDFTVTDQSGLMRGAALPPGLRFPTGSILGNHLIVSGTYLANTSQSFSIWALDLTSFTWQRIDAGTYLSSGSWNRGTLWRETNKYIVMGNRDRSLVADYNHRQQNFDHISFVELEAFGIYQPPPVTLSLDAQLLGLQSLGDESLADFELIPEVSTDAEKDRFKFLCSSRILEARWPWFRNRKATYNAQLQAQNPSSIAEQRLMSRTLNIPESPTVIKALLEWFYTSALVTPLQLSQNVLASLLGFSRTYGLEALENDVKHAMHSQLEPATAVQIHEAATLCGARMLQIRALRIVMASNKRVVQHQNASGPGSDTGGIGSYEAESRGYAAIGHSQSSGGTGGYMRQPDVTGSQYGRQRAQQLESESNDPSIHLANLLSRFATSDVDLTYNGNSAEKQPQVIDRPISPNTDPKRVSRIINLPSVMNLHEHSQNQMETVDETPPEIPSRPTLSPPALSSNKSKRQGLLNANDYVTNYQGGTRFMSPSLPPPPQTSLPSPQMSSNTSPAMSRVGSSTRGKGTSPLLRSPMPSLPDEQEYSPPISPRPYNNNYNYSPIIGSSEQFERAPSSSGNVGLGLHDVSHISRSNSVRPASRSQQNSQSLTVNETNYELSSPSLTAASASTFPTSASSDGPLTPQDFEMLSTNNHSNPSEVTNSTNTSYERSRSYSQFSSVAPSVATTSATSSDTGSQSKRNRLFGKFSKYKDSSSDSTATKISNSSSHNRKDKSSKGKEKEPSPSLYSSHSSGEKSNKSMSSGYFSQESKEARKVRKDKERTLQRQRVEAQRLAAMKRDGKVSINFFFSNECKILIYTLYSYVPYLVNLHLPKRKQTNMMLGVHFYIRNKNSYTIPFFSVYYYN